MGSSLSPILGEIYMNDFENQLSNCNRYKEIIKLWISYIHDILDSWEDIEVQSFVNDVNTKDTNLL